MAPRGRQIYMFLYIRTYTHMVDGAPSQQRVLSCVPSPNICISFHTPRQICDTTRLLYPPTSSPGYGGYLTLLDIHFCIHFQVGFEVDMDRKKTPGGDKSKIRNFTCKRPCGAFLRTIGRSLKSYRDCFEYEPKRIHVNPFEDRKPFLG